jgi:flagellar basal-body rod protein FlgF/flagellar basal-body rod protein FlgG
LQGTIQPTGNPLDLAIAGKGYFAVKTQSGLRYTRDGEFRVSAAGTLETKTGAAVLDNRGNAIAVPSGEIKVGADGSISVATADGSAVVGQVAVVELGEGNAIQAESASLYLPADGSSPKPASNAVIQQGAVESSNQDAITGTVQLLSIQRQAEMMQRALSVFHNDFDKTASEELARV